MESKQLFKEIMVTALLLSKMSEETFGDNDEVRSWLLDYGLRRIARMCIDKVGNIEALEDFSEIYDRVMSVMLADAATQGIAIN